MIDTAIAIFCFNRPDALCKLLDSLKLSKLTNTLPLYFYIDAARFDDEVEKVEVTQSIAEAFVHSKKSVIQREINLGLRASLTEGIDEVLTRHEAVIVLEDDLVLGPFALDYFLRALNEYKRRPQVVSICGYAIGASPDETSNAANFLPMTHPWGWATWRDRWKAHRAGTPRKIDLRSPSFRASMNVFGLRNYVQMLALTEDGFLNSWWIYWQLNAINRHTVSLFPKQSHIVNAGLLGGTHASRNNLFIKALPQKKLADRPTEFPHEVLIDFDALDRVIRSDEARVLRFTGFLGAIKRKLKRIAGW